MANRRAFCHTLLMTADRTFHNVDPSLRHLRHGQNPLPWSFVSIVVGPVASLREARSDPLSATTGKVRPPQLSQQCCDNLLIGNCSRTAPYAVDSSRRIHVELDLQSGCDCCHDFFAIPRRASPGGSRAVSECQPPIQHSETGIDDCATRDRAARSTRAHSRSRLREPDRIARPSCAPAQRPRRPPLQR